MISSSIVYCLFFLSMSLHTLTFSYHHLQTTSVACHVAIKLFLLLPIFFFYLFCYLLSMVPNTFIIPSHSTSFRHVLLISNPLWTFVSFFAPFPTLIISSLHSLLTWKRCKKNTTESTENNNISKLSLLHVGPFKINLIISTFKDELDHWFNWPTLTPLGAVSTFQNISSFRSLLTDLLIFSSFLDPSDLSELAEGGREWK